MYLLTYQETSLSNFLMTKQTNNNQSHCSSSTIVIVDFVNNMRIVIRLDDEK